MIAKSNFHKSADQFSAEIDQLIFRNYILQSLNHVDIILKSGLIKSGYNIVPSPSTALVFIIYVPVLENVIRMPLHNP